jgi:NADH:ubiquinone oxidoreductase subunit K
MDITKKLSPFTLLPSNKIIRSELIKLFDRNLIYSIILGVIVAFVDFLLNLIGYSFSSTEDSINSYNAIVVIVIDIARVSVYIGLGFIAYYFPRARKYVILTTPLIFTITVTELHIALDCFENVYLR